MTTIGTCSHCGGPVQVPSLWGGSVPPVPECSRCGAKASNPYGVVIPMDRPVKPKFPLLTETAFFRDKDGNVTA